MAQSLQGKKVALLVANGFEQAELLEPRKALQQAGAQTQVVSPEKQRSRRGTKPTGDRKSRSTSRSTTPTRTITMPSCSPAAS